MLLSAPLLQQLVDSTTPTYPAVTGLVPSITVKSLGCFVYALGWAWLLLIAFTGWGRSACKLLGVQRMPASIACAVGIAVAIFLGGLLNLAHAIYGATIFGMVAIGLLLYFLQRKDRPHEYGWGSFWRKAPAAARLLLVAALLVLIGRVSGTVRLGIANGLDDGTAYLVFPHKMAQLHSFAPDPFSERRVTTSLGGGYLLQEFVISATSLTNAAMADRGLGLILLGGILFDLAVIFDLSILQIAWLELLAYLVPQEAMNLTFIVLPVSMLLGLIWMMWRPLNEEGSGSSRFAVIAGLIGGAIISLKSTYLPCVGAFILVPCILMLGKKKAKLAVRLSVLAGIGALFVLFAWMLSMKLTSGTYLFPVFGHGVDYSSYRLFPSAQKFSSGRRFVKIFVQGIALLVLAGIQLVESRTRLAGKATADDLGSSRSWYSVVVLLAAAIAITAINYASGGDSIWRYNFPQFFSAILLYYIVSASMLHGRKEAEAGYGTASIVFSISVVSLVAMIFYYDAAGKSPRPFRAVAMAWGDYLPSLRASLTGQQLENPQIKAEYRAVENSLPAHAVVLENTAYPFLFNYHRRRILVADWPGAASPVPGWPFRSRNVAVASYLTSNSIRYIVYDYRYGRWTDFEGCKALEGGNLNSEWLKEQWRLAILSHHQFDNFRARYRWIYDDGNIAVIDLNQPLANPPATASVWILDTNKDEMCLAIATRYLANPLPAQP